MAAIYPNAEKFPTKSYTGDDEDLKIIILIATFFVHINLFLQPIFVHAERVVIIVCSPSATIARLSHVASSMLGKTSHLCSGSLEGLDRTAEWVLLGGRLCRVVPPQLVLNLLIVPSPIRNTAFEVVVGELKNLVLFIADVSSRYCQAV